MPPKAKTSQPSKKTVEKKKEKIIEDKTFGLKIRRVPSNRDSYSRFNIKLKVEVLPRSLKMLKNWKRRRS
ncbi:hypothetical protein L9F63_022136 [Diploptera punctata]|uniref:Uncharacterized protein n=1 Tax=Diploptera punctata TaxID=6984 RepID=A0AAD7ZN18_DIPPU|nr:hypothetical protein L9F63_022136 [Diploptera punctata]